MIKRVLFFIFLNLIIIGAKAQSFNTLLNEGKWATAKLWLLQNKQQLSVENYLINHLQLCYFLNEVEISKAYCDTIILNKQLTNNTLAIAYCNLSLSRYFQYHKQYEKSLLLANKAVEMAQHINFPLLKTQAVVHQINISRYLKNSHPALFQKRFLAAKSVGQYINQLPDSLYVYKARMLQSLALLWSDLVLEQPFNHKLYDDFKTELSKANNLLLQKYQYHPQLAHQYLIDGFTQLSQNADSALKLVKLAYKQLRTINDGSYGIYIHLSYFLNDLMDRVYIEKYKQTQKTTYLNQAIVWAKYNLWLDQYKQQYEGFYFYRRHNNRNTQPAELRISNHYFTLYQLTKNTNYLNFALKYAEYLRHKPILKVAQHQLYNPLTAMVKTEQGNSHKLAEKIDYTENLISNPLLVAKLLSPNEAIVEYMAYPHQHKDSVTFLAQLIANTGQTLVIFNVNKNEVTDMPDKLFDAIEHNNIELYKKCAYQGYVKLFKPILCRLNPFIKQLHIIQPAYFNKPLLFEGFIADTTAKTYAKLNYVFNNYNISYATSLTHFVERSQQQIELKKVGIWAPNYLSTQFAEITEQPAIEQRLNQYFNTYKITYDNKQQLINAILNAQILHVTAHANGNFNGVDRPRIYTELANSDSVLLDVDVEGKNNQSDLAILAACKSNVGNMLQSGSIDGFTRALLSEGCRGTVCSLFKVEESVTTQMLAHFYSYLAAGLTPDMALYESKKQIKQQHPEPIHWQAFIYTGANQTFKPPKNYAELWLIIASCLAFALTSFLLIKRKF